MSRFQKLLHIFGNPQWALAFVRHGVAAATEHMQLLRAVDLRTVVDIGANRGQFALAARRYFPEAEIYSFEPLPAPAAEFRRVFSSDPQTRLAEAAIGPASAKATMHVSTRDDSSSLLPITAAQTSVFPGTEEADTSEVNIGPLGDFVSAVDIAPPALLKLDVQGYELDALRGCERLLDRFEWIYAECSFMELYAGQALADEVIAWLRERGFVFCGVYNVACRKDGMPVQADFLFRRENGDKQDLRRGVPANEGT